jgi:hypothetical protein
MGETLRRWWHFRACGWVADHAPEGLIFNCVLRAYGREFRRHPDPLRMTAEHLLNRSGDRAEAAARSRGADSTEGGE